MLCSPECLDDMDNGKPGEKISYELYYQLIYFSSKKKEKEKKIKNKNV